MRHTRGLRAYRAASVLLSLLGAGTVVWPDWLELLTGLDPDRGQGWAEWLVAALCALGATASERVRRRRLARRPATA